MAGFLVGIGKAGEVAERSPAVISANLKEDMLMRKKVMVLDRSERSVVHQIKVDQKVLYKRFQSRLVRSQLTFARIMGKKDVEKTLRANNIGGLNTDIAGSSEEDYVFLAKLETRPCTATSYSPRLPKPKPTASRTPSADVCQRSNLKSRAKGRSLSANVRLKSNERETSTVTVESGKSKQRSPLRPATTLCTRVTEEFIKHKEVQQNTEDSSQTSERGTEEVEQSIKDNAESDCDKQTDVSVVSEVSSYHTDQTKATENADEEENDEDEADKQDVDKKQGVSFLDELNLTNLNPNATTLVSTPEDSPPISPKQYSRRTSKAFFQEEEKIDLVELRLKEAKALDFTDKVAQFCEDLESVKSSSNMPNVDYYQSRLEAASRERSTKILTTVPGTPDEENKRAMGNVSIPSLTLPVIDWNF